MKNIKLIITYDGTPFFGWQETPTGPSIEGSLKKALCQILQENISLQAASRTDRGVHALNQVVNFFTRCEIPSFEKFLRGLNALLPLEIRVLSAEIMPLSFHPTLDSIGKEYVYKIWQAPTPSPFFLRYSWHIPFKLDLSKMEQAAYELIGTHDFAAFCNFRKGLCYSDTIRKVQKISIEQSALEPFLEIRICADRFVYKMACNIVGTLVDVGRNKLDLPLLELVNKRKRIFLGVTAPPHGLTLIQHYYPNRVE